MKGCNMTRVRLIVFDLDETLVHATEVPLSSPEAFRVGPYLSTCGRLHLN